MTDISQLRYLRLTDHLIGFYDGRVEGHRFAAFDNWVYDGALSLGICSYALIDGGEAIVYDTHVSVDHDEDASSPKAAPGRSHHYQSLASRSCRRPELADCPILPTTGGTAG